MLLTILILVTILWFIPGVIAYTGFVLTVAKDLEMPWNKNNRPVPYFTTAIIGSIMPIANLYLAYHTIGEWYLRYTLKKKIRKMIDKKIAEKLKEHGL